MSLIGWCWSRDQNTGLWLVNALRETIWGSQINFSSHLETSVCTQTKQKVRNLTPITKQNQQQFFNHSAHWPGNDAKMLPSSWCDPADWSGRWLRRQTSCWEDLSETSCRTVWRESLGLSRSWLSERWLLVKMLKQISKMLQQLWWIFLYFVTEDCAIYKKIYLLSNQRLSCDV